MAETRKQLILWVEDDPTSAVLLRTIIDDGKYGIPRADCISAAIDRVLDDPGIEYFSYIVLDLNVPYGEGDFSNDDRALLEGMTKTSVVPLSGWIWLKSYVLQVHPEFDLSRIIIYSRYTDNLPMSEKETYKNIAAYINKNDAGLVNMYAALNISW